MPGNDRQGVWVSPLLETVFGSEPKWDEGVFPGPAGGLSLRGDVELAIFFASELHRSYWDLLVRWILVICPRPRSRRVLAARVPEARPVSQLTSIWVNLSLTVRATSTRRATSFKTVLEHYSPCLPSFVGIQDHPYLSSTPISPQ